MEKRWRQTGTITKGEMHLSAPNHSCILGVDAVNGRGGLTSFSIFQPQDTTHQRWVAITIASRLQFSNSSPLFSSIKDSALPCSARLSSQSTKQAPGHQDSPTLPDSVILFTIRV
ncbi:hypothetical protein ACLOJK_001977, partial [Asimina triloba]